MRSGTKAEVATRIRELQEAQGIDPFAKGKQRTPLREQVVQLNRHKKNKAMLVAYVTDELGLMLNGNETMEQIEHRAIKEIYKTAQPAAQDPVGFGRHASLSYAELRREQPGYVTWVKKTAAETNEVDPRLRRLANWLVEQETEAKTTEVLKLTGSHLREPTPEPDIVTQASSSSRTTKTKDGYPEEQGQAQLQTQLLQQLVATVKDLQDEMQEMKTKEPEKYRKQARETGTRKAMSASERLSCLLRRPGNHSGSEEEPDSQGCRASQGLSRSGELREGRPLSLTKAQQLEREAWDLAPNLFQGLAAQDRVILMEIACGPDSALTAAVQSYMGSSGAAVRAALWNSCDLGSSAGVKLILDRIQVERPLQVWISPPSSPYSPYQNTKQRNEAQKEQLQQKRKAMMKVYVGSACVFHECMKLGIHCTWEMPEHCNAWRLPLLQRLRTKYALHEAVTKGCAVNLRHEKTGKADAWWMEAVD